MTYLEKIEAISDYINKADDNILDAQLISEDMNNPNIEETLYKVSIILEDIKDELYKEMEY